MRNVARTPFVIVILLLAASISPAADNRPLIGKNVTVVKPEANFYSPNRQAASPALLGSSHLVNGVQGDWLLIGDVGLLRSSDVVPEEGALDYFNVLVRDKPSADSYLARGAFYVEQEMPEEAVADLTVAIERDPNKAVYYEYRGDAWIDQEEYDSAMADFNTAIRLDPSSADAYNGRGNTWYLKEEYESAIGDFNAAIRIDPKHSLAFANRGAAREALDDSQGALADYNESIRLDPSDAWVFDNRGALLSSQEEYDLAIADFAAAIRLDNDFASAYMNRGDLRSALGEYDLAVADYKQSLSLDPEDDEAWNAFAWLRATCPDEKYRDGAEAIDAATRASELTLWEDGSCLDTLAAAYAESGQFEQAIHWQNAALELIPSDEQADGRARLALYESELPYRQPLAGQTDDTGTDEDQ